MGSFRLCPPCLITCARWPEGYLRSFGELLRSIDDNLIARLDAAVNRHIRALRQANFYIAYRDRPIILHNVDERARWPALNSRSRHDNYSALCIEPQLHVDELIRKQNEVVVREDRLQAGCAGRGVYLVIDAHERAVRQLLL